MSNLEMLNKKFGIEGSLKFISGPGNLETVVIENKFGQAAIVLMGATILGFEPAGEEGVLWYSTKSFFELGKPIRGGIPICFPWFGPHPEDKGKPLHGFARLKVWNVDSTKTLSNGSTQIILSLKEDEETLGLWNFPFQCRLTVIAGKEMNILLSIKNTGKEKMEVTTALHTYFHVGDVGKIKIYGFDKSNYIDKVDGRLEKIQSDPITISSEVNRVYFNTADESVIDDPVLKRKIKIKHIKSNCVDVWNPWAEKCALNQDMEKEDYIKMVGVETAKTGTESIELSPGAEAEYGAVISLEK